MCFRWVQGVLALPLGAWALLKREIKGDKNEKTNSSSNPRR
nr:MAG TPA: hypothetical protein [Caudoviricetes sp.]